MSLPVPASSLESVLDVLMRAPEVHVYGIADVEQLWSRSRWWVEDGAAIAVINLPGSPIPVVYAISAYADAATLALVERVLSAFPPRFETTAVPGFAARVESRYHKVWCNKYQKMHLSDPDMLGSAHLAAVPLKSPDTDALVRLLRTDPQAGDFFHAGLLNTGYYFGIWSDDALIAAAGVHVLGPAHRVAAIGNVVTHPDFRGRGNGRAVMSMLCRRLLQRYDTIGLNVRVDNVTAIRLYTSLGFVPLVGFEEGEFVAKESAHVSGGTKSSNDEWSVA